MKIKLLLFICLFYTTVCFASPSVYPTGTTIYDPSKAYGGYTLITARAPGMDAFLIDMNGNVVNTWLGLDGFPNKILPGGFIIGGQIDTSNPKEEMVDISIRDWANKTVWSFNNFEKTWDSKAASARMHHDVQMQGNSVGYYYPKQSDSIDGNILVLAATKSENSKISKTPLYDDIIYEIGRDGKILWSWKISEHLDELKISESDLQKLKENSFGPAGYDWAHTNSASYLGKNKWYDSGDKRFHPDNIIISCRQLNASYIIDKQSGKVVWNIGPYYSESPELAKIGQIIGQHNTHMIPEGLEGEGNILIFDNGYNGKAIGGVWGFFEKQRDYSRVLEINPVTMELVWSYSPQSRNIVTWNEQHTFYSSWMGNAQRLPNGNTLIAEAIGARLFEVTKDSKIVWEWVMPDRFAMDSETQPTAYIYRAYRIPYSYIPQLEKPKEEKILPKENSFLRVDDMKASGTAKILEWEDDQQAMHSY